MFRDPRDPINDRPIIDDGLDDDIGGGGGGGGGIILPPPDDDPIIDFTPPVIDNLSWNGKDLNGYALSQGIYIYKLHVRNKSNNRTEIIHSKLLKLR